jgi:PAS domain S-box-containing protein
MYEIPDFLSGLPVMNSNEWREYLQRILSAIPVGVVVVDDALEILAFNPNAERITGLDARDAIGRPYAEVMQTQGREIADPLEEALETGQVFVNQRFYLRDPEDGDALPIRHSASVLTDEEGQVIGGVTIFADISEQVSLEREIRAQHHYLRDVMQSLPDGVVTTDADLYITGWNEAATRITGREWKEVVGSECGDVFGPKVIRLLERMLQGSGPASQIERITGTEQKTKLALPNGTSIPIGFNVSPISSEDGKATGGIIVFRSIQKRLQQRRQLIHQRRYLSQVLDLAPYGIFTVDGDLNIRTFNQAAEELTGATASQAIGRPYTKIIQIDETGGEDPLPDLLEDRGPAARVRLWLKDEEGKRFPVRYSAAALDDVDGQPAGGIVIFQDISDVVAAERTKNEFISMVSHELRTPLTSIRGFVTALLDGRAGELTDRQRRFLSISREQSDLLLSLINDLLDLTKIESGKLTLSDNRITVETLAQHAVDVIRPMAEKKGQSLTLDVADDLPPLWADENHILQVLQNLLSNAVKFTPREGEISLQVEREDSEICFIVEDNGVGIPLEEQERIFEPFYQVENIQTRRAGGTGLGLPIVKRILEAQGGHVAVESEPGVGSRFSAYIPIAKTPKTQVHTRPSEDHPIPRERPKSTRKASPVSLKSARPDPLVLVVDDDPATRTFVRFILEEEGYDVLTASSGSEALTQAASEQPDIITLDILMPEIDGFHVLDELKQNPVTADIPVCITSIIEEKAKGYRLGALDYITKPFDREDLLEAIAGILNPEAPAEEVRILIAEDDLAIIELVEVTLRSEGYEILTATDGVAALEILRREQPDLVLLDIMIPRLDGYDFIRQAKADPRTTEIPLLVLSVRSLERDINYALRLGADKYLVKASGDTTENLSEMLEETVSELLSGAGETGAAK